MMGDGEESLKSYDKLLQYSLSKSDKASVLYNKADTLYMMGSINQSFELYRNCLELVPCRVERYYALVKSSLEIKSLLKSNWSELLNEMQDRISNCSINLSTKSTSQNVLFDGQTYMESIQEEEDQDISKREEEDSYYDDEIELSHKRKSKEQKISYLHFNNFDINQLASLQSSEVKIYISYLLLGHYKFVDLLGIILSC